MVYVYIESEEGVGATIHTVCIGQCELDPDPLEVFQSVEETRAYAQANFTANKLRLCGAEVQLH